MRFDPQVEVTDMRRAERVAIAWGAGLLSGMLGLRVVDWESGAFTEEFDVDGTNACTKVKFNNRRIEKPDDRTYPNCDPPPLHPEPNPLTAVGERA